MIPVPLLNLLHKRVFYLYYNSSIWCGPEKGFPLFESIEFLRYALREIFLNLSLIIRGLILRCCFGIMSAVESAVQIKLNGTEKSEKTIIL